MRNTSAFDLADYELEDSELLQDDILVFVPKNPFRIHSDKCRTSRVLLSRHDNQRWWLVRKAIARSYRVSLKTPLLPIVADPGNRALDIG